MATVTFTTCDRCGVQSTYHGVTMRTLVLANKPHDVCDKCLDAKALENLQKSAGDDRMLELCGCSGSHLSDTLREIEEHMDE